MSMTIFAAAHFSGKPTPTTWDDYLAIRRPVKRMRHKRLNDTTSWSIKGPTD